MHIVSACSDWCEQPTDHELHDHRATDFDGTVMRCHEAAFSQVRTLDGLMSVRVAQIETVPASPADHQPAHIMLESKIYTAGQAEELVRALQTAIDRLHKIDLAGRPHGTAMR